MNLVERVFNWITRMPTIYQLKSSCYERFRGIVDREIEKTESLGVNENGAKLLSIEYAMEYSEREIKRLYGSSKGFVIPFTEFSIKDRRGYTGRGLDPLGIIKFRNDSLIESIELWKNPLDDEKAVVTFRLKLKHDVQYAKEVLDFVDKNGFINAMGDAWPVVSKEFMQVPYTRECFFEDIVRMLANALYIRIRKAMYIPHRYKINPPITLIVYNAPNEIRSTRNLVFSHKLGSPNMGTYMEIDGRAGRLSCHRWEFFCNESQNIPVVTYLLSTVGSGLFYYLTYERVVRGLKAIGFDLIHRILPILYRPQQVLRIYTSITMNEQLRYQIMEEYSDNKGNEWSKYVSKSYRELKTLSKTYLDFINGYSIQVFNIILIIVAFISIVITIIT